MLFSDFLKAAVNLTMGTGAALVAIAVLAATRLEDTLTLVIAAGWWLVAAAAGIWLGRRPGATAAIERLLSRAVTIYALPEVRPWRVLINRLWPLALLVLVSGGLALVMPQPAVVSAGFTILWALSWRRQASAVTALEDRDGVRFYIERTSPFRAIKVVRTIGWHRELPDESEPEAAI